MENVDKFSSIEQAAMEQSPSNETDTRHNFMANSDFMEATAKEYEKAMAEGQWDAVQNPAVIAERAKAATPEIEQVTPVVEAGGLITDQTFSRRHIELIRNVDQECSVEELIDLKKTLTKASKQIK